MPDDFRVQSFIGWLRKFRWPAEERQMAKPVKHVAKKHSRSARTVDVDVEPEPVEAPESPEPDEFPENPTPEPERAPDVIVPPPPEGDALAEAEAILSNLASQSTNRLGGGHGHELIAAAALWIAKYKHAG